MGEDLNSVNYKQLVILSPGHFICKMRTEIVPQPTGPLESALSCLGKPMFTFTLLRFFLMWTILKVFTEFLTILFLFWFVGHEACGIFN